MTTVEHAAWSRRLSRFLDGGNCHRQSGQFPLPHFSGSLYNRAADGEPACGSVCLYWMNDYQDAGGPGGSAAMLRN